MVVQPGQERSPIQYGPKIWATKIPTIIAFSCCLLLFFLPLIQIKSANGFHQNLDGISLATGFTVNLPSHSGMTSSSTVTSSPQLNVTLLSDKKDPDIFTLVALGLGIMGLFLSIVNARPDGIGGILAGTLAAAALIGLWLNRNNIAMIIVDGPGGLTNEKGIMKFTSWYYLLIGCFLFAAILSYRRIRYNR